MGQNRTRAGLARLASGVIAASLLLMSSAAEAKERRGAWIRIEKRDGRRIEGELLKVSGERLLLFAPAAKAGMTVDLREIRNLGVRRRRDAAIGVWLGFFGGSAGGFLLGKALASGDPGRNPDTLANRASLGAAIGMLAGGLIRAGGRFEDQLLGGLAESEAAVLLRELRLLARDPLGDADGTLRTASAAF